jgi:hypothetical protein
MKVSESTKNDRLSDVFIMFILYKISQRKSILGTAAPKIPTIGLLYFDILIITKNFLITRKDWGTAKKKLLQSGDVEVNPGPNQRITPGSSVEIKIATYNARGLKDKFKLKRVLNKCCNLLKENPDTFVLFQETHLDSEENRQLSLLWRQGYHVSPSNGRQGGTLILYNLSWNVIKSDKDENGKLCSIIATKYGYTMGVINVYAPNDHDINYFNNVYDLIFEYKNLHPEIKIAMGGDFNLVIGQGDSLNRNSNNAERRSRKLINEQNSLLGLVDS